MALTAPPQQSSPKDPATILKALNQIVTTHAFGQPRLELADDGVIVRKNSDGSVFRFKLRDIGEMGIDREAEAHVLLSCKAGAGCVERQLTPSASIQQIEMIVFSIQPAERGTEVLQLFRDLQAALAASPPAKR
jgi:hypothetical protein